MTIGILEFLYHEKYLYTLIRVIERTGKEIIVFTTKRLYEKIFPLLKERVNRFRWVFREEKESIAKYLKRVEKEANGKLDLLFINTLQDVKNFPIYLKFNPTCRKLLVTGRIEDWFGNNYRLSIKRTIKDNLIYNAKTFFSRRMLERFDGIVVHSSNIGDYAKANGYNKDIFVIPYAFCEENLRIRSIGKLIVFSLPGTIDRSRRDYEGLLNAFERLWAHNNKKVSLKLVGKPNGEYGRIIIRRCRELKARGIEIEYFNDYLTEPRFIEEIKNSDVLLSPINLSKYPHGGYTACVIEAIRFGKPALYPAGYQVPDELLSSSVFFKDISELDKVIREKILTKNELQNLKEKAIENARKISIKNISIYFKERILKNQKE